MMPTHTHSLYNQEFQRNQRHQSNTKIATRGHQRNRHGRINANATTNATTNASYTTKTTPSPPSLYLELTIIMRPSIKSTRLSTGTPSRKLPTNLTPSPTYPPMPDLPSHALPYQTPPQGHSRSQKTAISSHNPPSQARQPPGTARAGVPGSPGARAGASGPPGAVETARSAQHQKASRYAHEPASIRALEALAALNTKRKHHENQSYARETATRGALER